MPKLQLLLLQILQAPHSTMFKERLLGLVLVPGLVGSICAKLVLRLLEVST